MECTPLCIVENEANYSELRKYFELSFGALPDFFVRVPGRVNLIGEHIDYCGFFVLPMAIEQDIIMAVKINNTSTINLVNFDCETYDNVTISVEDLSVDTSAPQWYHYFICGYRGVAINYQLTKKGLDVAVKGTIPPSSGLSSSSALVCASALATCHANRLHPGYTRGSFKFVRLKWTLGVALYSLNSHENCNIHLTRMELASLCAMSEHYIGTQGGGMDQAIGFLAEPGAAKLIEFKPLKATNVPLPESVAFVVCNSCVVMNKAATSQFNTRVVECRLAAKVLAKVYGFKWEDVEKLAEIPILLNKDISEMKAVVNKTLTQKSYKRYEICSLLEIPDVQLSLILSQNTQHLEEFQLTNRAIHVFEEANRVREFKLVCEDKNVDVLKLGQLMNDSHASCRDLYDCSHPILDELVETAIFAGALGSRLTGAGWGGCCVSMVLKDNIQDFMSIMKKKFYDKRVNVKANGIHINSAMFATKPSRGAAVYV